MQIETRENESSLSNDSFAKHPCLLFVSMEEKINEYLQSAKKRHGN